MNSSPASPASIFVPGLKVGGSQTLVQPMAAGSTGSFELAAVILALFYFSGAFLNENQGFAVGDVQQNLVFFFLQMFVYLMILPSVVKNRVNILRASKSLYLVWALVLLALLSAAWSQVSVETLKHALLLFMTTVFGIYFGARFEIDEQLRYLTVVLGSSIVLSFLFALLLPEYGVMKWEHIGAWRGIYSHRNSLAHMMVLAVVLCLMQWRTRGLRAPTLMGLIGAATLIAMSGSVTGILVGAFLLLFFKGSVALHWKRSKLLAAAVVVVPVAVFSVRWLIQNWVSAMDMLGRSPTLSGRASLWILSGYMAIQRPWLGYGYTGFWLGPAWPSARIWRALDWPAMNGHNGFLDLWLSLGLLGLSIFILLFGSVFWRALKLARSIESPLALWPLAYLLFLFVYNLDESNLFQHNSIFWVLFVAVCIASEKIPQELRTDGVSPQQKYVSS